MFFELSEELKKMDQKTKLKPGCPKSKVNNTKNKGSDNSLLERVVLLKGFLTIKTDQVS